MTCLWGVQTTAVRWGKFGSDRPCPKDNMKIHVGAVSSFATKSIKSLKWKLVRIVTFAPCKATRIGEKAKIKFNMVTLFPRARQKLGRECRGWMGKSLSRKSREKAHRTGSSPWNSEVSSP